MSSIEFPIPEMTQGDDQQAMVKLSDVISPGFIFKDPEGHYMMKVAGNLGSDDLDHAERSALRRFHDVLGVLRAFKYGRGELQSELVRSPARGPSGAQVIRAGAVKVYMTTPGSLERFGESAYRAFLASSRFHEAVYLLGKPNRDAGDFYTIHELAGKEFGGKPGISLKLGISRAKQDEFTKSANKLRPADGGRHASDFPELATMSLDEISEFATDLMRSWIDLY